MTNIVYDEESEVTKTAKARKVKLNSLSKEALQRQRARTALKSEYFFNDPSTNKLWVYKKFTDIRTYWQITLKRCGLRYRRPYNMRHTYATLGLMSGANPGFLAKQPGHSKQMFFAVYADWIDGESDDREMAKIEAAIKANVPKLYPAHRLNAVKKGWK